MEGVSESLLPFGLLSRFFFPKSRWQQPGGRAKRGEKDKKEASKGGRYCRECTDVTPPAACYWVISLTRCHPGLLG